MNKSTEIVKKNFTLTLVGFTVFILFILGFSLYEANTIRFSKEVSSSELYSFVEDSPAVAEYLEQEKDYEAHFIKIANLVREDQQVALGQSLLWVGVPVIIASVIGGYVVSRRLLKPVEEAYESQERFIQDAAHELRNPLAAMSATVQSFATSKLSQKEAKLLVTMRRQTKRLVRIAEDLLFLERREAQELPHEVNISELTEDVAEDLRHLIMKKKQKLTMAVSPGVKIMIAEKDYILLVRNLLENAIKYTPNSKQISLKLVQAKNNATLTVIDKGIGIPQDELDMIGQRFFRATNTGKYDGNGLGMAIVQKVINRYGGTITLVSKVNKGTRVDVSL